MDHQMIEAERNREGDRERTRETCSTISLLTKLPPTGKDWEFELRTLCTVIFMLLLSKVEKSSEEIMEITQALNSIQALEGSRELENLIGFIRAPRFLKRDMQKTKELMTKATEQKLFEKKSSEQSNKDLRRLGSYEFLKAILP
ncbi:centromere protein R isoform X3 [Erinaceus europaeus]|uniref:Centromere protein R isoform X3 n=1 Tax=Erinaceus europaeus TaxID=9365 RepID=A0ABM3YMN7_ERIEU|nr:centromere protein R isoform X3 [Erinaceus europaeus]